MKILLLFVAIPLVVAAYNAEPSRTLDIVNEITKALRELPSVQNEPIDQDFRTSFVYNMILKVIKQKLVAEIEVPVFGKEDSVIYVENATIFGANETFITIDGPNAGYNVDNLTVFVPSLDITADQYILHNFTLDDFVFNGIGKLNVHLGTIKMHAKMAINFEYLEFVVKTISALEFYIESSQFDLENLGESGEEVSMVLNAILSRLVTQDINSANTYLQEIIEMSGGQCADEYLEIVCALISYLLTYLKNNLIF